MNYVFVFLLVSVSSIVFAQNRYHVDKTTYGNNSTIVYLKHDMNPINGILYSDQGDIGNYINGKRDSLYKEDGLHKEFWDNGQLKHEWNYKNGEKNGLYRCWTENGKLDYEVNYTDGDLDGIRRSWYENGQLYKEEDFINGQEPTIVRWWHENGQLKYEANYKDGLKRSWYENGKRYIEQNYRIGLYRR